MYQTKDDAWLAAAIRNTWVGSHIQASPDETYLNLHLFGVTLYYSVIRPLKLLNTTLKNDVAFNNAMATDDAMS